MKNKTKSLALCSLFAIFTGLSGCGGGSGTETPPPLTGPSAFEPKTYPRFDPVTSDLPFNTDLLFAKAATSDGTADLGAPTDTVRAAVNALDGFSTSAFFDVLIAGSLDPASAIANQSVFLVALDTGTADALDPANIQGISGLASFDVQVVSLDGGSNNVLRIRPTAPLKPKTKYLVILTNDLKDSAGAALTASWSYNALRDPDYETLEALLPVRSAILGWEALAGAFLAQLSGGALTSATAKAKLVLTYTFTTTDPQTSLMGLAAPRAALKAQLMASGLDELVAKGSVDQLQSYGLLTTPKSRPVGVEAATGFDMGDLAPGALATQVGKLYTGYIQLPYYQQAPVNGDFSPVVGHSWQPNQSLASALSVDLPSDVDGSYNLTYRFPFPVATGSETVPLQITLPEPGLTPSYAGGYSCAQVYGASGYPTVIYVHGITSDRTSILALAHSLASQCIATLAIDLPLHGVAADNPFANYLNVERNGFAVVYGANAPHERHFNMAGEAGSPVAMDFEEPGATDTSGAQFTNLSNLTNTRDNNREAVIDLLNLSASLGAINQQVQDKLSAKLDLDRVYVEGVSLGGILGGIFVAANQQAIAADSYAGFSSDLTPLRGLVLSSSGSQVSQIMTNSAKFGVTVREGLAAAGASYGTSNYERFVYAAQSAMDAADIVNFGQNLANLGIPLLIQEVAEDQVIPNSLDSAPLCGIEPLAGLMDTQWLGLGAASLGRGWVKMNAGGHTSILRPEGTQSAEVQLAVTAELQAQLISFVLNDGSVAVGTQAPAKVFQPLD